MHLASIIFLMPPNPRFISVIIVVVPYVGLKTEAVSFKVTNVEGGWTEWDTTQVCVPSNLLHNGRIASLLLHNHTVYISS